MCSVKPPTPRMVLATAIKEDVAQLTKQADKDGKYSTALNPHAKRIVDRCTATQIGRLLLIDAVKILENGNGLESFMGHLIKLHLLEAPISGRLVEYERP